MPFAIYYDQIRSGVFARKEQQKISYGAWIFKSRLEWLSTKVYYYINGSPGLP